MDEWCSEAEPNLMESSGGFSVRVLGRTGMRNVEGGRSLRVDSGPGKPGAIAVFKDSIKTWDGCREQVSAADRDRIAGNIQRAFEFCGYEIEVHSDFAGS